MVERAIQAEGASLQGCWRQRGGKQQQPGTWGSALGSRLWPARRQHQDDAYPAVTSWMGFIPVLRTPPELGMSSGHLHFTYSLALSKKGVVDLDYIFAATYYALCQEHFVPNTQSERLEHVALLPWMGAVRC